MTETIKILHGTHSVKALNSRFKQSAICAQLNGLGGRIFGSHLLQTRCFATPSNAADLPEARSQVESLNMELPVAFKPYIPNISDGAVKQILLPYLDDYVALTPVPSLNVIYNLNKFAMALPYFKKHCVQPVISAIANHGDPVCAFKGNVKLVDNWLPKTKPQKAVFDQPTIVITARCEGMNISGSYVATGLPQLTAVGGFIHVIERALNQKINFAFGVSHVGAVQDIKKGTNGGKGTQNFSKAHKFNLITDEITATGHIAFALQAVSGELSSQLVADAVKRITRFSGGPLFDVQVNTITNIEDYYWYHADTDPTEPQNIQLNAELDYMQNLKDEDVSVYTEWERENPAFVGFLKALNFHYRLIGSGYAMLHDPQTDEKSRADTKIHAWAEPLFSLIELGHTPYFFKYKQKDNLLIWE